MEIRVSLMDIIASYHKYLESKLGHKLDNMEIYHMEHEGAQLVEKMDIDFLGKQHMIKFK